MQAVAVALQREEAPPELAQGLQDEVVRAGPHTLLIEYAGVDLRIAALLGQEMGQIAVVVVDHGLL